MSTGVPPRGSLDPWVASGADDLRDAVLDFARTVCLPDADPEAIARAIAALANTRGGEIIIGARADSTGRVTAVDGIEPALLGAAVDAALQDADPPLTHLVRQRAVPLTGGVAGVIQVRLSPSAPHLLISDGCIYRLSDGGVEPIRSRLALDDLYARGRGERERADRLVEGMVEKLALGHYAFYSLAVVACTHQPSSEPYRAAQANQAWLAPAEEPFIAAAGLHEQEPRVSPGEIELRTPGEVNAFIRVTRTGCVAAGEVQRRPYHDELDTVAHLQERLGRLCQTVARLLAEAADPVMLPHIFVEGVRGLRLVRDPVKRLTTSGAPQDTGRFPLSLGDARDLEYVARLSVEAMERLTPLFPVPVS